MKTIEHKIISEKETGKSVKEFEIEVGAETFEQFRLKALQKYTADAELPGFRKGKAPETLVLKQVGEMRVLEDAANTVINELVLALLTEKHLRFIGEPKVSLTTLAPQNPLRFKITVTLAPEITLPDYKKIAAEKNRAPAPPPQVTEKELEESLAHIKKILSSQNPAGEKEAKPFELTDEHVKKLGKFKNIAEFTEKLKQDLEIDKAARARERNVLEIVEQLVAATKIELPEILVEHELDRIESEFSHDVERMGQKFDEYLAKIKKTRDDLRKEWKDNAEKRAVFELLIPHIARAENLSVPKEDIERETTHLLEHHKDASREVAALYVERSLLRQKVLDFLANTK